VVAVDGGLGLFDLVGGSGQFGSAVGVGVVELFLGGGDDAGEDGVGAGVEVGEGD